MTDPSPTTVVVAGAAGFVGSPLVRALATSHRVIALSRSERDGADNLEWRRCDLLSARAARQAVAGADLAVYLVHSMLPSDHLVQGGFEDFDLQAADNFARACAAEGVRQIVYLGGILPQDERLEDLSRHLLSRAEVEKVLAGRGVPVTVLRAGLIIGPGGSSTEILIRLARRLPLMLCPAWTSTPTQPIAQSEVLGLIPWVLGRAESFGKVYDIGCEEVLTYRKLMITAGGLLGRRPRTFTVPFVSPRLSRLWLTLVTGAPKALAAPLVESLSHEMLARDRRLQEESGVEARSIVEALRGAIDEPSRDNPRAFVNRRPSGPPVVRSVQRMVGTRLGPGEAADEYMRWVGEKLSPLIRSSQDSEGHWTLRLGSVSGPTLLDFRRDESSSDDRVVYSIVGGWLCATSSDRGRFEFRSVLGDGTLLCSVHDFTPRLWWPVYLVTQAQLHLFVMHRFRRHLRAKFPR